MGRRNLQCTQTVALQKNRPTPGVDVDEFLEVEWFEWQHLHPHVMQERSAGTFRNELPEKNLAENTNALPVLIDVEAEDRENLHVLELRNRRIPKVESPAGIGRKARKSRKMNGREDAAVSMTTHLLVLVGIAVSILVFLWNIL